VVKTGKDWNWPIVMLLIVYIEGHFYCSVYITMATTTTYNGHGSTLRDYYNNYYYIINKDACLERLRRSRLCNRVMAQQAQTV